MTLDRRCYKCGAKFSIRVKDIKREEMTPRQLRDAHKRLHMAHWTARVLLAKMLPYVGKRRKYDRELREAYWHFIVNDQ